MVRLGKKLVSNALLAAAAVSLDHAVAFALPAARTQALDTPQTQRRPAFKLEQSTFKLNPLKQSAAPNEASLSIDANDVAGGKRGVAKKAVVFSTLAALILSQQNPRRLIVECFRRRDFERTAQFPLPKSISPNWQ
mmetsp:Transcript_33372/g.71117  ORF Transcript_33372/g.71117 Transcript_33372/m.71117 type:complete len:136 (-) Transcript_33372:979-1386(-)